MKIYSLGINYSTEEPLLSQKNEDVFTKHIMRQFAPSLNLESDQSSPISAGNKFRAAEVQRQRTHDQGDPHIVGWTILVNRDDPRRDDYLRILRPLAAWRGMKDPDQPLLFDGSAYDNWHTWLMKNYTPLDFEDPPLYILIVGGPGQVPFRFQSFLGSAAVGRLDFDDLDDLAVYVDKVIALEVAHSPVVTREAIFFAPDPGPHDATYFSRRFMVEPLSRMAEKDFGFAATRIMQQDATCARLQETLHGAHPALVYTASHGLGAPDQSLDIQQQLNGAIVCQREVGKTLRDRLFSAQEIPANEPFLEGAVFFQFACFGYGTPARSDFANWDISIFNAQNAARDFVSALPRRLLAHPRGPIAYIGHIDRAYLHGFDDPEDPDLGERWSPRLKPFIKALQSLMDVQPVGLALQNMNMRFNNVNAYLTNAFENAFKDGFNISPTMMRSIASSYILRSDAQNYMVFGDPAARLRIPSVE